MHYPGSTRLGTYYELVSYALPEGEVLGLAEARQTLADIPLTNDEADVLALLDESVIHQLRTLDWVDESQLRDDPAQPLVHWWWHLGKVRAGTYPVERLPESLRASYRPKKTVFA